MNQNLRDFSDRFFFVRVLSGTPYDRWQIFERYEDASRCQKALVRYLKKTGRATYRGFPINQYITLSSRPHAWRTAYENGTVDEVEGKAMQEMFAQIKAMQGREV